jgi:hypothetical protein
MSYFFLATPLGKDGKTSEGNAFKTIQTEVIGSGPKASGDISAVKFDKSKFKIGTLDQLVKLNDALVKVDHHLETVIKKIHKQAEDISDDMKLKVETSDSTMEISEYIQLFQWDDTKYPRSRSLIDIAQIISEKMTSVDTDMKKFIDEYNTLRNQLYAHKKKEDGNFLSRDPGDIVYDKIDKKNFIHDSKFLRNVLVFVHKSKATYFKDNYESVGEGVVPRSARQLESEDKDGNIIFRVVVMENSADIFLLKCKQKLGFTAK